MAEDKFYIDYMPGVWYGKESEPPAFGICVVALKNADTGEYTFCIATSPKNKRFYTVRQHDGWNIWATEPTAEAMKQWTVENWLLLPKTFPDDEDEEGEYE